MTAEKTIPFSKKTWLLLFAGAFVLLLLLWGALRLFADGGKSGKVQVLSDNTVIRTLDLTEDGTFVVENAYGKNTVTVSGGRVFVSDADCPDKLCVAHGPLSSNGMPIICLPHHLVIRFENSKGDVDIIAE